MTRKEVRETENMLERLTRVLTLHCADPRIPSTSAVDIARADAESLRRISMTLHRWHELECGVDGGGIDRDEATGKCWWYSSVSGKRTHIVPDREAGARKRLAKIMTRYPTLTAYVQTDPRGCALYILTPEQTKGVRPDEIDAIYTRGLAVFK